jgi:DNA-binding FadR family transcriptional regulator
MACLKTPGNPMASPPMSAAGHAEHLIPVLAAAAHIACRRMTALHLKALHDSVEQAHQIPAALGWDRKAAAHAEIFRVLADAADAPLPPALSGGVGLAYDLMITVGRAANGMIISSRHRLLAYLRAGDADAAAREVENHLRVLHYMWRLAYPQRPGGNHALLH